MQRRVREQVLVLRAGEQLHAHVPRRTGGRREEVRDERLDERRGRGGRPRDALARRVDLRDVQEGRGVARDGVQDGLDPGDKGGRLRRLLLRRAGLGDEDQDLLLEDLGAVWRGLWEGRMGEEAAVLACGRDERVEEELGGAW